MDIVISITSTAVTIGFAGTKFTVREGGDGAVTVRVVKVGSSFEPLTVAFTTEGRTATSGMDFEPVSGVLIFSPSDTEKEISVAVIDDTLAEEKEHFFIRLSLPELNQTGLTLKRKRLRVEIEDNEGEIIYFILTSVFEYLVHELCVVCLDTIFLNFKSLTCSCGGWV